MNVIVWKDEYSTGHPHIDSQHQQLVLMVNLCLDCLWAGELDHLRSLLDSALILFEIHSGEEERVLAARCHPAAASIAAEHSGLVESGWRLRAKLDRGTVSPRLLMLAANAFHDHLRADALLLRQVARGWVAPQGERAHSSAPH